MAVQINFETDSEEFKDNGISQIIKVLKDIQSDALRGVEFGLIVDENLREIGSWSISV